MRRAKTIAYFLSALLLAGCGRDAAEEVSPAGGERPLLFTAKIAGGGSDGLSVGTRADESGGGTEVEGIPDKEFDAARDALLKKTFTPGDDTHPGDAIRISNVASASTEPSFALGDPHCFQYVCKQHNDEQGFINDGTTAEDNYATEHFDPQNPSDGWSEYLFTPEKTVDGTARGFYRSNLITDGMSYFRFYAFLSQNDDESSLPEVKKDQSKEEDFLSSDALFALTGHAVSAIDRPIRFIFYHAHAMLDVRLVLPVYYPGHKQDGDTDPEELPSGYLSDSVWLYLTNVKTDYRVAWAEQSTSGQEVPTKLIDDAERVPEIPMYRYHLEESGGHEEQDSDDEESKSSKYLTYGYCAIVPKQNLPGDTDHATGAVTNYLPLLRLYVKNPITGEKEKYVYIPSGAEGLELKEGTISVLHLKLSRTASNQLTIMGQIQEWDRVSGSMEALKDEPDE